MHDRVHIAQQLIHGGLSIVPIAPNGSKAPTVKWQPYQVQRATDAEVQTWFSPGRAGIGIIGGAISGNLEILDFDDGEIFDPWRNLANALTSGLVDTLPIVKSPSGGFHVYYRAPAVQSNQKLARHWDNGKVGNVRIETRGEGGYVLTPYCPPACHPLQQSYELLQGSLFAVPPITIDARTMFLNACKAFDEYVEPPKPAYRPAPHDTGARPGDVFAQTHSWQEILEPHGWKAVTHQGDTTCWKRPGKDERGWSATTGHKGFDVFYVFSSNAHPFEAERGYSKFAVYTLLNFNGDFHASAKALARR